MCACVCACVCVCDCFYIYIHTHNIIHIYNTFIYVGWRGADFTNVERFEKEFGASRILLEHNYRSTSTIVAAAQSVIERNKGRVDKKMLSNKPGGAQVHFHQMWDDQVSLCV